MKSPSRWLPGLRALLTIGRELSRLRHAVERLADAYEGKTPLVPLPEPDAEPIEVAFDRDTDYAHHYQLELRLTRQLGRRPTADELCRELDGEEHDPLIPTVVRGRRQPERELH